MTAYRKALALIAAATLVQLTIGALIPLDPDETYYWDWSRHLAAGYFDHPPIVALFVKLGVTLLGATPLGVRLVSVLANGAAMLLLVAIARRHGGDRAAWLAARIALALPILTGWLLLATPDPAFVLFAMATLLAVDVALSRVERSRESLIAWSAAGVTLGLAFASKYIAVLIPLSLVIAFVLHPRLRRRFAEPGPYVASLIAAIVFLPVVIWNADHDWASFRFQIHHGLGAGGGSSLDRVLGYLSGQIVFVSPILFVLIAIATIKSLRRDNDPRRFVLGVICALVFSWFLVSSVRQPVEANWPLLAYPAGAIVLALASGTLRWDRILNAGIAVGAALVLLIYLQMLVRVIPLAPGDDPVRRGHGWDVAARAVDSTAMASVHAGRTWIAANRYQDASELAFNMKGHPTVFSLNITSRPNQYDLWDRFAMRAGQCDNLLLLIDESSEASVAKKVALHFKESKIGALVAPGGGAPLFHPKRIWEFTCWDGGDPSS